MQPSQLEIQREVEALRDIRRRSTTQGGPGTLILDPDLPNPSSPPSPTTSYWTATSTIQQLNDGDSSSGSHEDSSSSEERVVSDDPFHLFWVPARLHPEIAPAEFRAFLKEHARTPPPDGANSLGRSLTTSSPSLERRRSMLSRQYKPPENGDVEDETIVPVRRNRTVLAHTGPQLTISDLQRLEEFAEEATKDGDPSKFRTALRRTLSLNVSPSAIDQIDISPMPDEADAPIIVPPPGQILRRAARTKIRKASLQADGEGRGFSARRRRTAKVAEPRSSSDLSSSDLTHEQSDSPQQTGRARTFSNESMDSDERPPQRSDLYNEETSMYDAYREDVENEIARSLQLLMPQPSQLSLTLPTDEPKSLSADTASEPPLLHSAPEPELQHPQPQRLNLAASIEETPRTPSPDTTLVPTEETAVASTLAELPVVTEKPVSSAQKKEKDKKGLFGKWGGNDKTSKKITKVERDREKEAQRIEKEKEKEREKEKESGFFGSLFSSKRKQDDSSSQTSGSASGRETAAALLGASKGLPTSPSPQLGFQGPYARYPIHVERAIYRLSHIKLANPRRPLYEQVLISNLMFWYLGVINKTQNPTPTAPSAQGAMGTTPVQQGSGQEETERREVEEQQRAESELLEQEKQEREREQKEKERERERELQLQQQQQKEKSRRGTLTKANPTQQGPRRAGEMLVKGPQYEMQHRVMEQEYRGPGYGYGSPSSPTPRQSSPPNNQSQPTVELDSVPYMYSGGTEPQLPPGAMSPVPNALPASPAVPRSRSSSPSSPPNGFQAEPPPQVVPMHRSRSPPPQNHNRYSPASPGPGRPPASRGPTRSLSATVGSGAPLSADGKPRKVVSAHAVVPSGRPRASIGSVPMSRTEEEDVPLAVYQQRRRR